MVSVAEGGTVACFAEQLTNVKAMEANNSPRLGKKRLFIASNLVLPVKKLKDMHIVLAQFFKPLVYN
jgi:hypothetical protein